MHLSDQVPGLGAASARRRRRRRSRRRPRRRPRRRWARGRSWPWPRVAANCTCGMPALLVLALGFGAALGCLTRSESSVRLLTAGAIRNCRACSCSLVPFTYSQARVWVFATMTAVLRTVAVSVPPPARRCHTESAPGRRAGAVPVWADCPGQQPFVGTAIGCLSPLAADGDGALA